MSSQLKNLAMIKEKKNQQQQQQQQRNNGSPSRNTYTTAKSAATSAASPTGNLMGGIKSTYASFKQHKCNNTMINPKTTTTTTPTSTTTTTNINDAFHNSLLLRH